MNGVVRQSRAQHAYCAINITVGGAKGIPAVPDIGISQIHNILTGFQIPQKISNSNILISHKEAC